MTESQYYRAYNSALKSGSKLTRQVLKKLKETYIEAAQHASSEVIKAIMTGQNDITANSWYNIQLQLEKGARAITDKLDDLIMDNVGFAANKVSTIDEKYLIDIIDRNKIGISKVGVRNLFVNVNERVITDLLSRVYATGYTYSESVWRVGLDYQKQIKQVISSGLSAGRDLIDIAADMTEYVKKDRRALIKRWGDLKAGDRAFLIRIRKNVDYNALRLVRSELYASLQNVSKLNGQANPGCSGWYDWIRQTTEDFGCDCPDNESNSPYTLENVPGYAHANCLCIIQPLLRDRKQFVDDLKRWSDGESVDYLDKWNTNYFQFVEKSY